jgi:hypothetical protein
MLPQEAVLNKHGYTYYIRADINVVQLGAGEKRSFEGYHSRYESMKQFYRCSRSPDRNPKELDEWDNTCS